MIREFVAEAVASAFANALTPKAIPDAPQDDALKLARMRLNAAVDGWYWGHRCTDDLLPSGWTATHHSGAASPGSVALTIEAPDGLDVLSVSVGKDYLYRGSTDATDPAGINALAALVEVMKAASNADIAAQNRRDDLESESLALATIAEVNAALGGLLP